MHELTHTQWCFKPACETTSSAHDGHRESASTLHLRNTMEMNRQLHVCVQRKQEEISVLKHRNTQLMELIKQAEFYADVLNAAPRQPDSDSASAFTHHSDSSWLESLLNHTPPEEEVERSHRMLPEHTDGGVKRKFWPDGDLQSSSEDKKARVHDELLQLSERRACEQSASDTPHVCGSFRNYRLLKDTPGLTSDLWREGKCVFFKTSIREHSTVRTGVFPHGKTFTSHAADGGCRFLWIPKHT